MNILSRIYRSLSSDEEIFRKDFGGSVRYLAVVIAFLSVIIALKGDIDLGIDYYNLSIIPEMFLSIILIVSCIIILSAFLTFFLRIYKDDITLKNVLNATIHSFTPLYFACALFILFPETFNFVWNQKPMFLLVLFIYVAYLLNKAIKCETGIEGVFSVSAMILAFVLGYIMYKGNLDVIIFYSVMMALLYWKRKKFDPQGAVLLYRTKWGIKLMESISKKHPKIVGFLGNVGIWAGFLFMGVISFILISNVIKILINPATIPAASPVLPGVPIPGSPLTLPLWYGFISIFIVVVVHEFSHGVVAKLHKIKVKSSGILFMGPIMGAFVEPDEEQMKKIERKKQLAVLGAGPFSNMLLAGIAVLIYLALIPVSASMLAQEGAVIGVIPGTPAETSGLTNGMIVTEVEGIPIANSTIFYELLGETKPNQTLTLIADGEEHKINLGTHPEKEGVGYLGIQAETFTKVKEEIIDKYGKVPTFLLFSFQKLMLWLFIISFGIGIANLIPLGPVDGGRMILLVLERYYPEDKAKVIWSKLSTFFILVLLFVLFSPMIRWIGGQF